MIIDKPRSVSMLRSLWKEAFEDEDAFLDRFFSLGFSPERCRCAMDGEKLLGALYWFDVTVEDQKYAYLYAIATEKRSRGKGVCRALMTDTHSHLKALGYSGSLLVPASEALFAFYAAMGYTLCSRVREVNCRAGENPVLLRKIDGQIYAALRRQLLPKGAVVQKQENLTFLQSTWELYAGDRFVLAATRQKGVLTAMEYLGNEDLCAGILRALDCSRGGFRMPGEDKPFAMYLPFLKDSKKPTYFGLAFD